MLYFDFQIIAISGFFSTAITQSILQFFQCNNVRALVVNHRAVSGRNGESVLSIYNGHAEHAGQNA